MAMNNNTLINTLEKISEKSDDIGRIVDRLSVLESKLLGPLEHIAESADSFSKAANSLSTLERMADSRISVSIDQSTHTYASNYIEIEDSTMHYIDEGSGEPILFLHGNPVSSYVWRKVLPYLTPLGRCIAPDLIGFGKSGKPDIEYSFFDHVRYLERFIEKLGLQNITLVIQDWGSGLGFHYAMRHESNVKGIAFFEAMVKTYPSWDEFPGPDADPQFREFFRKFRTGGEGGEGWQLVVDKNVFVEQVLPNSTYPYTLTEEELNQYRAPFKDPKDRRPVWRFAQEIPIEGNPENMTTVVNDYSAQLQRSTLPKLLFYSAPGAVLTPKLAEWCETNIPNLKMVDIGVGAHFLQESHPHLLGPEIARWYHSLGA